MTTLCHLVPTVPPAFNGVGDYAYRLWEHWPAPRPPWSLAAKSIPEGASEYWPEATIVEFEPTAAGLPRALERVGADVLFLHYVPHTYNVHGVPMWLPGALGEWKRATGGRLFCFYHELYAAGPIWTKTGILTPISRESLRRLVRVVDSWATSTQGYFDDLTTSFGADPSLGIVVPVGPNIAPPAPPVRKPWPEDQNKGIAVVVFGGRGTKLRTLRIHKTMLKRLAAHGRIRSLLVVGRSPDPASEVAIGELLREANLEPLTQRLYDLPPDQVSQALAQQDLALIPTREGWRGKSGVLAACAAHGLRCLFPEDKEVDRTVIDRVIPAIGWPEIARSLAAHMAKTGVLVPESGEMSA